MNEQKERNIKHFENLVAMAAADGKIVHEEEVTLLNKSRQLELHAADAFDIFSRARKVTSLSPVEGMDYSDQLRDLMEIAKADGVIMPEEYQLCLDVVNKTGLSKRIVDQGFRNIRKVNYSRSA